MNLDQKAKIFETKLVDLENKFSKELIFESTFD